MVLQLYYFYPLIENGIRILTLALLFSSGKLLLAQTTNSSTEHQTAITKVLQKFMHCMTTKDSTMFYNLFYDGPVAWVGVYQTATHWVDERFSYRIKCLDYTNAKRQLTNAFVKA
jgi:hypothetical protein